MNPEAWYPIEWLLDLMDKLDKHVGHYGLMRMGRTLFKLSHKSVSPKLRSARATSSMASTACTTTPTAEGRSAAGGSSSSSWAMPSSRRPRRTTA